MVRVRRLPPFEKYSCELGLLEAARAEYVLRMAGFPDELMSAVLVVRNGKALGKSDLIEDGDLLDVIMLPEGG